MIPYLLAFGMSATLGRLSSMRALSNIRWVVVAMGGLCLCVLAACRDMTVGTDTIGYPWNIYLLSQTTNLEGVLQGTTAEPLFTAAAYLVSVLFHNYNILLFFINAAAVGLFIAAAYRLFPDRIGLAFLAYSLIFFGWTLNIMRQAIVASIFVWLYIFACERKRACFVVTVIISIGIHNTAILGLLIWPVVALTNRRSNHGISRKQGELALLFVMFFMLLLILAFVFSDELLNAAVSVKDSYAYQVRHAEDGSLRSSFVFLSLSFILITAMLKRKGTNSPLIWLSLLSFPLSFFSIVSPQLFRIAFMFAIFYPLAFCQTVKEENDPSIRTMCYILYSIVSIIYFYWTYIYGQSMEIYPYTSIILGI